MSYFIGLDWGTTVFRAYLMESEKQVLCDKRVSPGGMSTLLRENVEDYLVSRIQNWLQRYGKDTLVIGSGMIGSDMGLEWVDYVSCPSTKENILTNIKRSRLSSVNLYLVPGLMYQGEDNQIDSLRGEETQLLGLNFSADRKVVCMPGTHSKWVEVENHTVKRFRSALTGELYACLERSSLIRGAQEWHPTAFQYGVESGQKNEALLSALFQVRSHSNFQKIPARHSQCFLSGLLIATEIKEMCQYFQLNENVSELVVVGANELAHIYQQALDNMNIQVSVISDVEANTRGFLSIHQALHSDENRFSIQY